MDFIFIFVYMYESDANKEQLNVCLGWPNNNRI